MGGGKYSISCMQPRDRVWELDEFERIWWRIPTIEDAEALDALWSPVRKPIGWKWADVLRGREHCLYFLTADAGVLFAFAARPRTVLVGPEPVKVSAVRIDYLEVNPSLGGGKVAPFGLAAIAKYAGDCGATAFVLGAINHPKVLPFYLGSGATPAEGWSCNRNLVPLWYSPDATQILQEIADALEV